MSQYREPGVMANSEGRREFDLRQKPPPIFIGDKEYQSNTFPATAATADDELPVINNDDNTPLDELLRRYRVELADKKHQGFWSLKLLRHILSRDRVLAQLRSYEDLDDAETYIDYIRSPDDLGPGSGLKTYLKIFALLVLYERGEEISNFVREDEGLSDQDLPVCIDSKEKVNLYRKAKPGQTIRCFKGWRKHEKEGFETDQWKFLVPYFDLDVVDGEYRAKHHTLDDKTILPWCVRKARPQASTLPSTNDGGFAFVSCIQIDPLSHGFREVLNAIRVDKNLFALKVLRNIEANTQEAFHNELQLLQRFSGLVHDHLVTLLATFTLHREYHFLFPYADCDLDHYWQKQEPTPKRDIRTVRWVAKQYAGIMGAIDTIHDPQHLHNLPVKQYGRHGDIKPDNILWFSSSDDPRGILVVSDMGLSSLNRDTSRSNIPNEKIPGVPGYRPPECDIKGATISRAYDIWTLGCLFLEMVTWLLGGKAFLDEFGDHRTTMYITGGNNNIFFTLVKLDVQKAYGAQVKQQVREWFDKLHNNNNCSQFIHDSLDVIEKQMIVVLSKNRKRSMSGVLRKEFDKIYANCRKETGRDYCMTAVPFRRIPRSYTPPVQADLNDTATNAIDEIAKKAIKDKELGMVVHTGETTEPMSETELGTV